MQIIIQVLEDIAFHHKRFSNVDVYNSVMLTLGSVAHKLFKTGQTDLATNITSRINAMLGLHGNYFKFSEVCIYIYIYINFQTYIIFSINLVSFKVTLRSSGTDILYGCHLLLDVCIIYFISCDCIVNNSSLSYPIY